jgi:pilus assembly protein Flp/PilA
MNVEDMNEDRTVSRDERGATAVEYGLIVALIATVIITVVIALGTATQNAFNSVIGLF